MMPVRWLTNRSRTRWSACKSSCSAVLVATNFIVGRCTASAIASASRKSFFCPPRIWAHVFRRHQPSGVAKRCEFAAQVMRANTGFHANQARRNVRQPCFHLATRPLLPQHDRTALIETNNVERVLADIDADHGNRSVKLLRHGVLLVFGAPCQLRLLAGPEHGRTIPLADIEGLKIPQCSSLLPRCHVLSFRS